MVGGHKYLEMEEEVYTVVLLEGLRKIMRGVFRFCLFPDWTSNQYLGCKLLCYQNDKNSHWLYWRCVSWKRPNGLLLLLLLLFLLVVLLLLLLFP